ncbi:MAG TPA: glucose-1-phosphate thymidylyltransferase RfbA [Rhizomicrobium sp.]|jgi:glucose-1-phosphate thymidylyltransferase
MKGVVLAGGAGTRLYPLTLVVSKQLLPVYNKPMIYYPLSILMLAGIRDILIITTPEDSASFVRLLGNGAQWGLALSYAVQPKPEGLAQAFVIARDFIAGESVALVLGDNILHGAGLTALLQNAAGRTAGATVFAHRVRDPQRFGIVEFDDQARIVSVEEKPAVPRSDWALTGLYFFDGRVCDRAMTLKPSKRGEFEIIDLLDLYLQKNELFVERLGRGITWFDTGTHDALLDAAVFVRLIEERQKLKIACLEEIAWQQGFISEGALRRAINVATPGQSGYLKELLDDGGMGDAGGDE